ncbi:MAG: type II secretion system protein [Clostridiales bacterium]|nr:type II secretion system protein [Clostridiales bacterium]MBR5936677.1 type II secretion system protein [Clostridiales bacterium]
MVKLHKTKKGFTLVEMVLVIAILVILAMVVWFSVSAYLGKAKSATSKMNAYYDNVNDVTAAIDAEVP